MALVSAMLVGACGGDSGTIDTKGSSASTAPGDGDDGTTTDTDTVVEGEVSVWPLAYRELSATEAEGVSDEVRVSLEPSDDEELRVTFSDEEVSGTGDQWRAAAWNAVTVGTLLTGSDISGREFSFELSGRTDGPSAGALMTIAVIALLRGDEILDDITMTGTINPDGTVGPVGGIPYKIDGAVQAGKTRMLIPLGLRVSADIEGNPVDTVEAGEAKGVEVSEVADIYDAYEAFTGEELPRPGQVGNAELSDEASARIEAKVDDYLADARTSLDEALALDPTVQEALDTFLIEADSGITRAEELADAGLQVGAYSEASLAAAFANAAVKAGRLLELYFTQPEAFAEQLAASAEIDARVDALFQTLSEFEPENISDAAALVGAFGTAIDALSLSVYADEVVEAGLSAGDEETGIAQVAIGTALKEIAGSGIDNAQDVFEVGLGLGGAPVTADAEQIAAAADFFRKAAESNLAAFETVVLQPLADQSNQSLSTIQGDFGSNDLAYGLAQKAVLVLEGALDQILSAETRDYAVLGGAVNLYAASAALLAKYYSLDAQLDDDLNVVGIGNAEALASALDLAGDQVARAATLLTDQGVDPTLVVANLESASIDREGTDEDKLNALSSYWSAFVLSRVLAYLGDFHDTGME